MSSIRKKCTKHEGMTVSFITKLEACPVCLRDATIAYYELNNRLAYGFVVWGLDWIRITSYHGLDREERNRVIESVKAKVSENNDNLLRRVKIVEEYMEVRKRFTW